MTIARNIENVKLNWSSGVVGTGCIFQGNNGNITACSYNGVEPDTGAAQNILAKLTLNNGETIWNLSGNLEEHIDLQVPLADKAYVAADGNPVFTFREFTLLDTNIGINDVMEINTWQSDNPLFNSTNGIGQYYGGNNVVMDIVTKGGRWSSARGAGIYTLTIDNVSTDAGTHAAVGFRCTYTP